MTDPTPPVDDEIVAAVFDGEASADERAQVEADPTAPERLERFAAGRRLVGSPVPVPADARERAIAAALAEFDHAASGPAHAAATAAVGSATEPPEAADELGARRAATAAGAGRPPSRAGRFLAVAAAVVVVLIGVGAVIRALNPPSDLTVASSGQATSDLNLESSTSERLATDTDDGPQATTTAPGAVSPAPVPTTVAPATTTTGPDFTSAPGVVEAQADLGTVSTPAQLREAMTGLLAQRSSNQGAGAPPLAVNRAVTDCATYLLAVDPEIGELLVTGAAVYQGRPAIVFAFAIDQVAHPAANGSVRIYAVDANGCSTFSVQTL